MATDADRIKQIAQKLTHLEGALLPVLHAVQDEYGYLPEPTASSVADVLNLSRAEVHGVISFYHLFRETPPGKRTLYVCRAEACQSMGANALVDAIRQHLDIDFHETTADGKWSLEPIYCLGNCACAPAVMVDDRLHGRVTQAQLEHLLD